MTKNCHDDEVFHCDELMNRVFYVDLQQKPKQQTKKCLSSRLLACY